MPEIDNIRATAEAIGRITCIKTGAEIGLLYRWDNFDTQAALYDDGLPRTTIPPELKTDPDHGANRGQPLE